MPSATKLPLPSLPSQVNVSDVVPVLFEQLPLFPGSVLGTAVFTVTVTTSLVLAALLTVTVAVCCDLEASSPEAVGALMLLPWLPTFGVVTVQEFCEPPVDVRLTVHCVEDPVPSALMVPE